MVVHGFFHRSTQSLISIPTVNCNCDTCNTLCKIFTALRYDTASHKSASSISKQVRKTKYLCDMTYNILPVKQHSAVFSLPFSKIFSLRLIVQQLLSPLQDRDVSSARACLHYFAAVLFCAIVFITISEIDG